jgi:hypothetical protein
MPQKEGRRKLQEEEEEEEGLMEVTIIMEEGEWAQLVQWESSEEQQQWT